MTLFKLMNISFRVIRLILLTADRRDSASLMRVPTRLCS